MAKIGGKLVEWTFPKMSMITSSILILTQALTSEMVDVATIMKPSVLNLNRNVKDVTVLSQQCSG